MAPQLFSQTHTGDPKVVVTEFVDEMNAAIAHVSRAKTHTNERGREREKKKEERSLFLGRVL